MWVSLYTSISIYGCPCIWVSLYRGILISGYSDFGASLARQQLETSLEIGDRLLIKHAAKKLHDGEVILGEANSPRSVVISVLPLPVKEVWQCNQEAWGRRIATSN